MSIAYELVVQSPIPWPRKEVKPALAAVPKPLVREDFARLRDQLAASALYVRSGAELLQVHRHEQPGQLTTNAALDDLLGGGLPKGTVIELSGRRSSGRFAVVLSSLAAVTSTGEPAALIDLGDHLDPAGAETAGIDLPLLLWVRPQKLKQALTAAEMLIATGFPLVVIDAGLQVRGRRADEAVWLRLTRAAASHRAVVLVSSPYPISGSFSEAAINFDQKKALWLGSGRSPRLLKGIDSHLIVEKFRHHKPGRGARVSLLAAEVRG
ncbi:MAG TPA: hypothetical protein VHL58_10905 [Thermoanaerobaculia bacterium]|nr:hypothetical protein [Thermoanaerobaculia bacterium]